MPFSKPLTRQDAVIQWKAFLPKVVVWAGMRTHVWAGHPNGSRLHAALRFRSLLKDEILEDTLASHAFPKAEKWLQGVCWRGYWKGWLERRPQVWTPWRWRVRISSEALPKEGAWDEAKGASAGGRIFLQDVASRDVAGHEVWGELDAPKAESGEGGEGGNETRFGQARDSFEDAVSSEDHGGENLCGDVL